MPSRSAFISGMAGGIDIWAAETVLSLHKNYKELHLICAIPYEGFELHWDQHWQFRYRNIVKNADLTKFICRKYCRECFQLRNKWMVDHSSMVIAAYNGSSGGTKNTIKYANSKGVHITYLKHQTPPSKIFI